MPSEKQVQAWPLYGYAPGMYSAKCTQCGKIYQGEKRSFNCLECAVTQVKQALTAAEQAEPAPDARSGAVKVKALEWEHGKGSLVGQEVWSSGDPWTFWIVRNPSYNQNYVWCENLGFADNVPASPVRGSFDTLEDAKAAAQADYEQRILAALEPAETETDAEPDYQDEQDPAGRISAAIRTSTRPPESRLREALEKIARGLSLTFTSSPTKMSGNEAQAIARAALAQEDGR